MSVIPEVKCRRCGESFSALRSRCPNCGTRRVAQSGRTPATTPGTVKGTAAYERAETNTKWQMIFGLILVVAVILAVIVMVTARPDGLDNPATTGQGTITAPTPRRSASLSSSTPWPTPWISSPTGPTSGVSTTRASSSSRSARIPRSVRSSASSTSPAA